MAHEHKLEIFRGLLKFKSNTQKIWGVLVFLTIVTAVEVCLGITKPAFLTENYFFRNESFELDFHYFNFGKGLLYCLGLYAPKG